MSTVQKGNNEINWPDLVVKQSESLKTHQHYPPMYSGLVWQYTHSIKLLLKIDSNN